MKKLISILVLAIIFSLFCTQALAGVPQYINYQGKLTDDAGGLIVDTTLSIRFRIYTDSTGGSTLWDSTYNSVQITNGLFSVLLANIPDSVFNGSIGYLGVTVGSDSEATPRKPFVSVGYAYQALHSDTAETVAVPVSLVDSLAEKIISVDNRSYGGGVQAVTRGGNGVYGQTSDHSIAWVAAPAGVTGETVASDGWSYGVKGLANTTNGPAAGVYGYSANSNMFCTFGVWGDSRSNVAGAAGVVGSGSGTDTTYGVYYSGGLAGSGTKSCVVKTSQGPTLLYCQESPENWFEDFGEGQLTHGRTHIELDALFLETVTIDAYKPMKVFVQLNDENCLGVAVKRGLTGFDVIELNGGRSSARFTYRVVAKRKGFENKRLDRCAGGVNDPYLYPELRDEAAPDLEGKR